MGSEVCPKCGSKQSGPMQNGGWTYQCGTFKTVTNRIQQTAECQSRAKDARIAALTEELERVKGRIQETIDYVKTGIHCRMVDHKYNDSCDCGPITDEFAKILKEPT